MIDIVRLDNFLAATKMIYVNLFSLIPGLNEEEQTVFPAVFRQLYLQESVVALFIRRCYNIGVTQVSGHWCTDNFDPYCLHLFLVLDLEHFVSAALFAPSFHSMCFIIDQRDYLCCGIMGIQSQCEMSKQERTSYFSNQTNELNILRISHEA